MRRLLAFACVLGLMLLGGCALLMKGEETRTQSFDYTKAGEMARAECVPEGARLIKEEFTLDGNIVTDELTYEDGGKEYTYRVSYAIIESYQLESKEFVSSK